MRARASWRDHRAVGDGVVVVGRRGAVVARRRLGQVADVGVVRLAAVGVVRARAEVDGLVTRPTGDVVVRAGES